MTWKMWFCAIGGMFVFGMLLLAIPIDIELVKHHLTTISRWHMLFARRHPWFPLLVATCVLFPIGMFVAHYWSPKNVPFWETVPQWWAIVVFAPVILMAGILVGRWLVAQTL